jgi:SHS2 domain-containing protein
MTLESFYRTIEHTADIGIEVEASDKAGIFTRSGLAVFDLMFGLQSVDRTLKKPIRVAGDSTEELLVAWLNELLYVYAVERMVFSDFSDARLEKRTFSATGLGEKFDPGKHSAAMEIKAATYHGMSVVHEDGRWKASIIFDV